MFPAEYAALSRYLNELTGRDPSWAPPIEAVHHASLQPGWDTVAVLWCSNHHDMTKIVLWDAENTDLDGRFIGGFYADSCQGPSDPMRVAQQRREVIMCFSVFSYGYKYPKPKPAKSALNDTFKVPQIDFRCDGEFGDPEFFIGDCLQKTAYSAFNRHMRQYINGI